MIGLKHPEDETRINKGFDIKHPFLQHFYLSCNRIFSVALGCAPTPPVLRSTSIAKQNAPIAHICGRFSL
jgi:hypothetical protein